MKHANIIDMTGKPLEDADQFPASKTVHWPSGAVYACDMHALAIVRLGNIMGSTIPVSYAPPGARCQNCINESKGDNNEE